MTCTPSQRRMVNQRVEVAVISNVARARQAGGQLIGIRAAIQLAFVLGVRMGMSHPNQAGDFMGRWIQEHTNQETTQPEDIGHQHQLTLAHIVWPLLHPELVEGLEDDHA